MIVEVRTEQTSASWWASAEIEWQPRVREMHIGPATTTKRQIDVEFWSAMDPRIAESIFGDSLTTLTYSRSTSPVGRDEIRSDGDPDLDLVERDLHAESRVEVGDGRRYELQCERISRGDVLGNRLQSDRDCVLLAVEPQPDRCDLVADDNTSLFVDQLGEHVAWARPDRRLAGVFEAEAGMPRATPSTSAVTSTSSAPSATGAGVNAATSPPSPPFGPEIGDRTRRDVAVGQQPAAPATGKAGRCPSTGIVVRCPT